MRLFLTALMPVALLAACTQPPPVTGEPPTLSVPVNEVIALNTETVTDALVRPWGLAFLPDGDMIVTQRTGGVKRVNPSGTITDITGAPVPYTEGQAGLFDVILSPDFASDKTVFISYAKGNDAANNTAVFKARLSGNTLSGGEVIFEATAKDTAQHYGGRMAFLPDGTLLLTTGDGFTYREAAQDPASHLGKILRLTTSGKAAGGNPFAGDPNAAHEVYSAGHRNVQGLAIDPATGIIWSHEHGPKGGDELNRIEAGANYGWPIATYGVDYSGAQISPYNRYGGTKDAIHNWTPSIAPSGMTVYRGDLFKGMDGDILLGALKFEQIHRLHMKDGRVAKETLWLSKRGERMRDVQTGPDGAIYVLTDSGKLLRVTPAGIIKGPAY